MSRLPSAPFQGYQKGVLVFQDIERKAKVWTTFRELQNQGMSAERALFRAEFQHPIQAPLPAQAPRQNQPCKRAGVPLDLADGPVAQRTRAGGRSQDQVSAVAAPIVHAPIIQNPVQAPAPAQDEPADIKPILTQYQAQAQAHAQTPLVQDQVVQTLALAQIQTPIVNAPVQVPVPIVNASAIQAPVVQAPIVNAPVHVPVLAPIVQAQPAPTQNEPVDIKPPIMIVPRPVTPPPTMAQVLQKKKHQLQVAKLDAEIAKYEYKKEYYDGMARLARESGNGALPIPPRNAPDMEHEEDQEDQEQ